MMKDEFSQLHEALNPITRLVEEARGRGAAELRASQFESAMNATARSLDIAREALNQRTSENEKLTQVLEAKNAQLDAEAKKFMALSEASRAMVFKVNDLDKLLQISPRGRMGDRTHLLVRLGMMRKRVIELADDGIPF